MRRGVQRNAEIVTENGALEGEWQGIGAGDGVIELVVRINSDDRPENFLATDIHMIGRVQQHGSRKARRGNRIATAQELRTGIARLLYPGMYPLHLTGPSQWPDVDLLLQRVADPLCPGRSRQPPCQFVDDRALGEHPLHGYTDLARMIETAFRQQRHDLV